MDAVSGYPGGGLRGANAGLPLVALLQVWSLNHFSGLVSVGSMGREGKLHFSEGEIVHAEADGLEGEPAVWRILSWTDVEFTPFPNTTTLKRTIQKRVSHLLLDAHREIDEARRAQPAATPAPDTQRSASPAGPTVLEQLRALRGVIGIVRFGADGRPAGAGAAGSRAESLAAKGLYLAMTHAGAVREAFGLRDLWLATLESPRESLIVIHTSGQYLGLEVAPGTAVEPIAAQVRAVLARSASR